LFDGLVAGNLVPRVGEATTGSPFLGEEIQEAMIWDWWRELSCGMIHCLNKMDIKLKELDAQKGNATIFMR
jgi:hypothetical protein